MLKHLPQIALFGALFLSVINVIAAVVGFGPALAAVFGWEPSPLLSLPLALLGAGGLILSWLNSFMSNRSGLALYLGNAVLAPFGHLQFGLPLPVAIALALAPLPFYRGLRWLGDRL